MKEINTYSKTFEELAKLEEKLEMFKPHSRTLADLATGQVLQIEFVGESVTYIVDYNKLALIEVITQHGITER